MSTVSQPGPVRQQKDWIPLARQDGRTIIKWLNPIIAARCRVLYQDAAFSLTWLQQGAITEHIRGLMYARLSWHCAGSGPTDHADRFEEGCRLLQMYPTLPYEEQLKWLAEDRLFRRFMLIQDQEQIVVRSQFGSMELQHSGDRIALERCMQINQQQIAHLDRILECQPFQNTTGAASTNHVQSAAAGSRTPLSELATNAVTTSRPAQAGALKRKREGYEPEKQTEIISIEEDSEDEVALQGQVDAIQAKIAAIRKRTAYEDELIPGKKQRRPAKTSQVAASHDPLASSAMPLHRPSVQRVKDGVAQSHRVSLPADALQHHKDIQQQLPHQHATSAITPDLLSHPAAVAAGIESSELHLLARMKKKLSMKHPGASDGALTLSSIEALRRAKERVKISQAQPTTLAHTAAQSAQESSKSAHRFAAYQPVRSVVGSRAAVDLPPRTPAQPTTGQPPPIVQAPPVEARTEPPLCKEQQQVVDLIMAGHNVFYTGSAGCGKSTVLKSFVSQLRDRGKTVRIIAPTGKAALDINGSTTWTYAGWTPGHMKRPLEDLLKAAHGKFVHKRLTSTDVLVIDEVSMVENHILARLNALMKKARNNDRAFGGVQLVVTGDFCQLPPVKPFQYCMACGREQPQRLTPDGKTVYRCPQHGDCNDDDKWAFRSSTWEECKFKHVNLTNIHRQSDEVFIRILQKLRVGIPLTNADRTLLLDHPCEVTNAVKLFPTREEVRRINQTEFDRLSTAKRSYSCLDYFRWNEQHGNLREKGRRHPRDDSLEALREHRLETQVEYKAGMLVVLLINLDIANGLVNGSQGRIIGFEPYSESKLPKASINRDDSYSRSFGSYRGSKSKSRRDRDSSAEPPTVQGELRGEYATLREEQIREFILQGRNEHKMWPIVQFDNNIRRTIYADCQVNELGDEKPYTLLARTQIPLIAAWAMTIHKSQGMTLNKVIVDLGKSFEEGQEYVALSRARSLDGLKVMALGENVGKGGNEQVKQFLKQKFGLG